MSHKSIFVTFGDSRAVTKTDMNMNFDWLFDESGWKIKVQRYLKNLNRLKSYGGSSTWDSQEEDSDCTSLIRL